MFEDKTIKIYSSRDQIRQQLIKYGEKYLDIKPLDLTKTSYMSYLINILSVLTSNLIYYNSATYREFFLTRAQQKESVLNLSTMLGYTPSMATPSRGTVLIQMPTDFESSVLIRFTGRKELDTDGKYKTPFRFYAKETVFVCENTVEVRIIKDGSSVTGIIIKEIKSNSDGTPGQNVTTIPWTMTADNNYLYFNLNVVQIDDQIFNFSIPNKGTYQFVTYDIPITGNVSSIEVKTRNPEEISIVPTSMSEVDSSEIEYDDWTDWEYTTNKNSLYLINQGEYGYAWRTTENGIKIFWGNDVIGTQPTAGDECFVVISTTDGVKGNVISGSINACDRLYAESIFESNIYKNRPVKISVINKNPMIGGTNYPTIDEIRKAAMVRVSTNKRLVTEYDYQNINIIVDDLPIQHAIPILKRSDLKRNEIVLFTDILYREKIVPTRNETIEIDGDENENLKIESGDIVDALNIEGELLPGETLPKYISMFDITIDPDRKVANYCYILDEVKENVISITSNNTSGSTDLTPVYPKYAKFKVTKDTNLNRVVDVFLVIRKTMLEETSYQYMKGYCSIGGSSAVEMDYIEEMEEAFDLYNVLDFYRSDDGDSVFHIRYSMDDDDTLIEDGELAFKFSIKLSLSGDLDSETSEPICDYFIECQSIAIIKQNLNQFMYSMCGRVISDGIVTNKWRIFDVPLILKDWWDYMLSLDLRDELITEIYNRIVSFDVSSYRMMTDFVNLKFSNTYGPLTNMRFNIANRGEINGINPSLSDISCDSTTGIGCIDSTNSYVECDEEARWAVTNIGEHPWLHISKYDNNTTIRSQPFIAQWNKFIKDWLFSPLITNDIMTIKGEDNYYIGPFSSIKKKYIFNGESIFIIDKKIPLELLIDVWIDPSYSSSNQSVIDKIKRNIIENMFSKMGYDKPIYRSELIKIIQETQGVKHCVLLKPEHDIFFSYNIYEDFTQEEVLRYSPQLVQITEPNIEVVIRSE